ncbi:MAG: hypothetical protein PHY16_02500 [Methylobacter sp.]|nr:hypothetical protein [Methylobacter sp.]
MVLNPNKSNYQVQELATRWAKLFDETITNSYVLQNAIDGKFSLYTVNSGLRCINLCVRAGLGRPSRKIVAYLNSEFIKLADFQIRELLCGKQVTILFLNLSESDFIQGDECFDLSEIEAAILDENERIIITPDDISYLSVMVEDIIAFERELECVSNEHQATTNAQNTPTKTIKVAAVFSKFKNLRANQISLIMMEDKTAVMVIDEKKFKVSPDELGLNSNTQEWKLLEGAAANRGDLSQPLRKLNSSRDLEAEKGKIKTAVCRLRKTLRDAMGLKDNPIKYMNGNGYKFTFKTMTHEALNGSNVTKGADAMDYLDNKCFDNNQHGSSDFWEEE